MPETIDILQAKLQQLQEENQTLRDSCEKLQQAQSSYEQILGDNNANLLRTDMAQMELEQIFSAYTDATWVVREDGIVLRANDAMLKMIDKTATEVIGKTCSTLLDYDLCDQENCPIKNSKDKSTRECDVQFSSEKLKYKHFLQTSAPLITIDGTPGIIAQFKDITSRKEAEAALEKANRELEKMAHIDGLTQIANRRCLDETLAKEWRRLGREQQPLSLLLGDIDFFKKFNDHYGHQAGDDCLRLIGKALADSMLRPADLAARYGGEEFAMLLPGVDIEGALQVAQRALSAITQLAIKHHKSDISEVVTISLGAATLLPTAERAPKDLIALADKALYQSKELGRNRVTPASPAEDTTQPE